MKIFVPSMSRAHVFMRYTGKMFLDTGLEPHVNLVVPASQAKEYENLCKPYRVRAVPDRIKGIGRTRSFALDHWKDGEQHVFQVDDDVAMEVRIGERKTVRAKPEDVVKCFDELQEWVQRDDIALAGVGMRFMYQQRPMIETYNQCVSRIFCVDTLKTALFNVRFDTMPLLMEDVYVCLRMITKGYKTVMLNNYLITGGNVNAKGGCSEYRDVKAIDEHITKLERFFPGLVQRYYRTNKSWNNMGEPVPNARIQWKKAYNWKEREGKDVISN